MRMTWVLAALLLLVPLTGEAKPRHHKARQKPVVASPQRASALARKRADNERSRRENERAEAELAEIRSGQLREQPQERDFPTQQSDDAERPPH